MIAYSVRSDAEGAIQALRARASQIPFATSLAINRTAGRVKDAEYKEMVDVFDRPTPYTLNSLYVLPSTKQDLRAVVALKDQGAAGKGTAADKYLTPEIKGGGRVLKRFERAFRAAGVLPDGYYIVPGAGAPLDAYGNVPPSFIVKILSYFKAFGEQGYHANIRDKRRAKLKSQGIEYFASKDGVGPAGGKLPPGVWMRVSHATGGAFGGSSSLKPIFIFVKSVLYPQRFDFQYVAQQTIAREFPDQMKAAAIEVNAGVAP